MASNIINAIHTTSQQVDEEDHYLHAYGAMITLIHLRQLTPITTPPHQYRRILFGILHAEMPEDVWFAEQDLDNLKRDPEGNARDITLLSNEIEDIWEEDREGGVREVKVREEGKVQPCYFVGQIMTHSRYGYTGLILGWDTYCKADESWIIRMGVDRLKHGRLQPFYKVLSVSPNGERSQRYVAEENIIVSSGSVGSYFSGDPAPFLRVKSLGKWFDRWDGGMFVPNGEVREEYVDDWKG
ncbi:F-box protein 21 [Rhizophlyctis rosea]|uniref:F-box protein 21 n=1 Tax=Rhizophlyctis rosea TaxID=64517 RepID=A0AAD5SCF2_9FUNG|nr:F-box protein 21 [Rhizophlyctis rosea]